MDPVSLIALLSALAPLAGNAIEFFTKAKEHLAQADELTPELEAAFDERIAKIETNPEEWQKQQPL